MKAPDLAELSRFVTYAQKRFKLPLLASCFADARPQPQIPSRAVGLSLLLGEVVQIKGFAPLAAETRLPQWQRWMGYTQPISHDTFGYASADEPGPTAAGGTVDRAATQAGQGLFTQQNQRPVGRQPGRQRTVLPRPPLL